MSYKTLQLRRDTAANWTSNDPTLLAGEVGVETDTLKFKIGDGSTAWTVLAYAGSSVSSYADLSALDGNTDVTGAELEELTDGSETTLHSHSYVDFVDRGNLSAVDYNLGSLTADGNWHNLDLSSIVPAGAKAVKLRVSVNCTDYTTNNYIKFRKNGNTDSTNNIQLGKAFVNNLVITTEVIVFCDASRIIEYAIINTLTQCDIIVCSWFTNLNAITPDYDSAIRVYHDAKQSIPGSTWTKIQFNTEEYDIGSEFDNAVNHRFTANAAGYYHISACISLEAIADGKYAELQICKNGDPNGGAAIAKTLESVGSSASPRLSLSTDVYLDGDADYIEIYLYQNNAGAVNIRAGTSENSLCIHRFT